MSGIPVLRGAALYGANAAGKSNLLRAVDLFCHMFADGNCSLMAGLQFMLGREHSPNSSFDIVYSRDDNVFRYQVETDGLTVVHERLDRVASEKSELIFNRRAAEEIELGPAIGACDWYRQRTLAANLLYLPKLMSDGLVENREKIAAADVLLAAAFGLTSLFVVGAASKPRPMAFYRYFQQRDFKDFLLRLLKRADLGVTDLTWTPLSKKEVEILVREQPALRSGVHIGGFGRAFVLIRNDEGGTSGEELQLVHNGIPLRAEAESDGTVRLLHLSPMLYEILHGNATWFIDEADCHLHPLLARYLLKTFMDRETSDSQVIVTVHDTTLMSHDIWRTDEIWFAEKRLDGSTDLYSLYQFQPRHDKKLEKGYLQGLYGALPCLGGEMMDEP
ncbi:MAG: ATP/GTP-binding protein [Kiritimatiellia bacterium]